jgi:hypothetical protein
MHCFILEFHSTNFYVCYIGYLCDKMKFIDIMLVLLGFHFLKIVYTWFRQLKLILSLSS